MSIIKVASKKAKNGYTYKVTFKYKEFGVTTSYSRSGFLTKKEAKEHENMIKAEIKENGCIKKQCTKTLNQVYNEFLEVGCDKYQHNTLCTMKRKYDKYVKDSIGRKQIAKLTYHDLQKYFNDLKHLNIETNKIIKRAINSVFIYALKSEYTTNNPISLVDVKGTETIKEKEKILNFEDFKMLIDLLKKDDNFLNISLATIVEIGYYTGLRISEIMALDKEDIDFNNGIINVDKKLVYDGLKKDEFYTTHQMKSKKSKSIIPLAPPLKQSLIEWFEMNPYDKVICDLDGYYLDPCNSSTKIKKVANTLGINFHFHMLRHSFITNLVTNGIDVKTVQELARHSNINTTMSIYTHIQEEHKKKAINNVFNNVYSKNTLNLN